MPLLSLNAASSVLAVVDMQPSFLGGSFEAERVLDRVEFLMEVAGLLEVPVLVTEQYSARMGGTHERLSRHFGTEPMGKMAFSCAGCAGFMDALAGLDRRQVVIVGIETHICVSQTAHDLLRGGFDVAVCPDAVSARSLDRHKLGMERIRDAGAVPAHTESIAYEWMGSAEHPKFREVLSAVKAHQTF
jgi:nicotinamidase-related amidase